MSLSTTDTAYAELQRMSDGIEKIFLSLRYDEWLGTEVIYGKTYGWLDADGELCKPSRDDKKFLIGALEDMCRRGLAKRKRISGGRMLWKAAI